MARLLAFGGDNGRKALAELDAVDLAAIQVVSAWGVNGKKESRWTFSPCPRSGCGGAIVSGWNDACILRAHGGLGSEETIPELTTTNGRQRRAAPRGYAH
jgi:hypothetical protein